MSSYLRRTLALALVLAVAAVAPAWGATKVSLSVSSATADAIHYKVSPVPSGEYTAAFSTSLKGAGPRQVFRFSDHDADGGHTWNGRFKAGNRGLKLCLGQSSGGKLISAPSWDQVCSSVLSPRKTFKPLSNAVTVKVKRRKVTFTTVFGPAAGNFARVTLTINKSAKAKGRRTRKASRGVKLKSGKTTYKPDLRPGETLRSAKIKLEDDYHRYAATVKR